MREVLAETGSAELVYWGAWFALEDERRLDEMKTFGLAGL